MVSKEVEMLGVKYKGGIKGMAEMINCIGLVLVKLSCENSRCEVEFETM